MKIQNSKKLIEKLFHSAQLSPFSFHRLLIQNFENPQIQKIDDLTFSTNKIESLSIPYNIIELKEFWCDRTSMLNDILVPKNNHFFSFLNNSFLVGKANQKSDIFDVLLFSRRDIKHVIIPPFISVISSYAFNECIQIESIEFPENSQLTKIDMLAFNNSSINEIAIPSNVTTIGDDAFNYSQLKSIEFEPNSKLEFIGKSAFASNEHVHVTIPESVNFVSEFAFFDNEKLETVEFLGEFLTLGYSILGSASLVSFPNARKVTNFRVFTLGLSSDLILFINANATLD